MQLITRKSECKVREMVKSPEEIPVIIRNEYPLKHSLIIKETASSDTDFNKYIGLGTAGKSGQN